MSCRRNIRGTTKGGSDVCAMKPHKRHLSEVPSASNPLSAVVFCLLTDLPSISEMAYPCTYQIVYLVTARQYHRSKKPVRTIVSRSRTRNIHLKNVPEHFPLGSFVLLKSITTANDSKEVFLWDSSRAVHDKNLRLKSRVFHTSCAFFFKHHSKCLLNIRFHRKSKNLVS